MKVNVDIPKTTLMGSDFIPRRQMIITLVSEDIQDMKTFGKAGVKKATLEAITKAIEKKLDELVGG